MHFGARSCTDFGTKAISTSEAVRQQWATCLWRRHGLVGRFNPRGLWLSPQGLRFGPAVNRCCFPMMGSASGLDWPINGA